MLTLSGRVITLKGVKPEGIYQWGRQTFYLYGVIEPLTGECYFDVFPQLNAETFEQFMHQFAERYSDRVLVVQLDRASAHQAKEVDWSDNLIPILQPAYSPEVNPIERLWEYLKAQLKWETFENLDALRQRVKEIVAQLTPEIVMSSTGWDFILDAVLSLSS